MMNDDRWLLAVIVVECAAAAMVVVDGGNSGCCRRRQQGARGKGDTGKGGQGRKGKGKVSKGKRVRADEGARARAMVDMADDNSKQQERASYDRGVRRRSSKIYEIGCDHTYLFFDVGVCALASKKFWFTRDSAKDR
jgi:hypothetical protein